MSSATTKRKKRKAAAFAITKLLKLLGAVSAIIASIALIIATAFFLSFIDTQKNDKYTIKLRTQQQTKATTVKVGDSDILKQGYFPISALNGVVGVKVVGDSKGIIISNPSGSEIMEIVPDSNIVTINGVRKKIDNVILYKKGECYLPIELVSRYTCLSVSYDEKAAMYTVSSVGTKDISFFPKNSVNDTPVEELEP